MTDISPELLDSIHSTSACMVGIRELAGKLAHLSAARVESFLLKFVDGGKDREVSRLLQACAFNKVQLDPTVLCRCIGVCEEMPDSAPCFALQDKSVVQPLLATSVAEELPSERKIYAAALAAELSVKFDLDPQPVRKVLWKHEQTMRSSPNRIFIAYSLELLKSDSDSVLPRLPPWSGLQLSDLLPEHRARSVVGGDYTVRRPIAKLGRNQPCHCGSGKKYKKCCYGKDQELLRDASQYAGTTRSELKNQPSLVDDPAVILRMPAYELKRLKPSELSANQLIAGYQCAADYGLRGLAFEMLTECQKRPGETEFDQGHFEDLIERVLEAGDLDLARRIRDHCGEDAWYQPRAIQFRFDLLENPRRFEPLVHDCRKSVCGEADQELEEPDEPLIRLAYDCAPLYPALAIVLARAAIASYPDRDLDSHVLLDLIHDTRVDLDLEPWSDPVESLFDWIENRAHLKEKEAAESEKIKQLSGRLETARAALAEKKLALQKMERMVKDVVDKPERGDEHQLKDVPGEHTRQVADHQDQEETLQRLRVKVVDLKAEINTQHEQRGQLRKLLEQERKKSSALSTGSTSAKGNGSDEERVVLKPSGKPILPEYADTFRRTCESLAPKLAAKAILAAGRFAAHDNAIWRQTKPVKRLPEHYRIRITLDYRMILHWQPGKSLRILDVIPRQDLESWIKRHG